MTFWGMCLSKWRPDSVNTQPDRSLSTHPKQNSSHLTIVKLLRFSRLYLHTKLEHKEIIYSNSKASSALLDTYHTIPPRPPVDTQGATQTLLTNHALAALTLSSHLLPHHGYCFFLLLIHIYLILCVCVCLNVYVGTMWVKEPSDFMRGVRFPETRDTNGCKSPCGFWDQASSSARAINALLSCLASPTTITNPQSSCPPSLQPNY